jgi:hypothetical protein
VLQGAVFLAAAFALVATLAHLAPGGIPGILAWAEHGERARVFHLEPLFALADASAFGTAVLGALFLTLAVRSTS